jgi:glycosyltransferase involved in cell wall biosynthesis
MTNPATPKVSIVMPVLKTRFLREAIESAVSQDYPNLEVLAIDDGSTEEEMPGLLASFAESHPDRFRYERQENQGQSRTINRAMELATGEIAGYLSDDDLLRPGAVRRLVEVLVKDPEAVVAYPAYEIIDEQGKVLDTITPTEYSLAESMRLNDSIAGAGVFYRAEAFRRVGGWATDLHYRADYEFWLRMSFEGKMLRIPEPLAAWRLHQTARTISDAGLEMARETLEVVDRLYAMDDLPAEVEAVKDQAYRNAFVQAGMGLTLWREEHDERFHIFDRHMPKISVQAAADRGSSDMVFHLRLESLSDEIRQQREHIAKLDELLAQRDGRIAYLERPWWWRMFRRVIPKGLRPIAKRIGGRFLPGRSAGHA